MIIKTHSETSLMGGNTRQHAVGLLQALAVRLGSNGWYARLNASADRSPRLYVADLGAVRPLIEHIIAVQDLAGTWSFWFEHGRRIASADALDEAVAAITAAFSASVAHVVTTFPER